MIRYNSSGLFLGAVKFVTSYGIKRAWKSTQ